MYIYTNISLQIYTNIINTNIYKYIGTNIYKYNQYRFYSTTLYISTMVCGWCGSEPQVGTAGRNRSWSQVGTAGRNPTGPPQYISLQIYIIIFDIYLILFDIYKFYIITFQISNFGFYSIIQIYISIQIQILFHYKYVSSVCGWRGSETRVGTHWPSTN